jgi:hypothetical protein
MNKLKSINITFVATDKIALDVRFTDVAVELKGPGFVFKNDVFLQTLYRHGNTSFKVVKKDEFILLQSIKTDPNLNGFKNMNSSRASDYEYFYPYNTKATRIPTIERYGTNFSATMNGYDIELRPILIEETKDIRQEILKAIMRYDQKNN